MRHQKITTPTDYFSLAVGLIRTRAMSTYDKIKGDDFFFDGISDSYFNADGTIRYSILPFPTLAPDFDKHVSCEQGESDSGNSGGVSEGQGGVSDSDKVSKD